jgi:hypothetical protein
MLAGGGQHPTGRVCSLVAAAAVGRELSVGSGNLQDQCGQRGEGSQQNPSISRLTLQPETILLQPPNIIAFKPYVCAACLQTLCPEDGVCAGAAFAYDLLTSLDQERK